MTVLLLMLSVVMAWIEDRLSVQMMICLLLFDVRWVQASVISAYQWIKGYSMGRQQNKTLEISSRRASFFNFDKESRLNRDRRPRVPASCFNSS